MYTIFVNTSKWFDRKMRRYLFDDLRHDGKLLVLDSRLDALPDCAEQIADLITRSPELGEQYKLLVYVEIGARREAGFAEEYAAAIRAEEELLAELWKRGRSAQQALILFGEHFAREELATSGEGFRSRLTEAFWKLCPIPDERETGPVLRELRGDPALAADRDVFGQAFAGRLQTRGDSFLPFTSATVAGALRILGGELFSGGGTETLAEGLFRAALDQYRYANRPVTDTPVQYAYVRIRDADCNESWRSEFRTALFVYFCAVEERLGAGLMKGVGDESFSPATSTIPDLDWQALERELNRRDRVLETEQKHLETPLPGLCCFNQELLGNADILSTEVKLPDFITMKPVQRRAALKSLRAEADRVMEGIRSNDLTNHGSAERCVTRMTDKYNETKDDLLGRLVFEDKSRQTANDSLTEDFIRRNLDAVSAKILSRDPLLPEVESFEKTRREAEQRINWLFDCLKVDLRLYLSLLAALLAFGVPYYAIQYADGTLSYGPWYFVGTMLVVALGLGLGCGAFALAFRRRIVGELAALCERFNEVQKLRRDALEDFRTLLLRDIPLSYCLQRYAERFAEYRENKRSRNAHITYHKRELKEYRDYLAMLWGALALKSSGKDEADVPEIEPVLNVSESRYQNSTVYSIIDEAALRESLLKLRKEAE